MKNGLIDTYAINIAVLATCKDVFVYFSTLWSKLYSMTKKPTILLKYLTVFSAFGGVALSLIYARQDGYSHWSRRLLYFTAQSNIWIGITFLLLLLLPLKKKNAELWKARLYLLKYIFTVCITMTGFIFCCLLAPFADEAYRPWSLCNLLTHVFTPILVIADLFLDEYPIVIDNKRIFLSLVPFLLYSFTASLLGFAHTDFGRGVPYPYFFFNYTSPAGVFGFSNVYPFYVGSFYWLFLFGWIILGIAYLYAHWLNKSLCKEKKKRRSA